MFWGCQVLLGSHSGLVREVEVEPSREPGVADSFTVAGRLSIYYLQILEIWSPEPGLNQRHPVYKTGALPTELSGPLVFQFIKGNT